jgi:alkylated DNA repair protein alkB family protein 1
MAKLHWAALGFHYDWTKRTYPNVPGSHVPRILQSLGSICAEAVGMSLNTEAVLVNYYKASSTMGGHQDDVEFTFDHPVVSFSLGCSAVFLKGTLIMRVN